MDNSGKEAEAMALLAEAERKVKNSQSFFSGLFGGSSKIEEACEIYARAANMFKMAKNWSAAGSAFCQAAQLHLQLQSKHDAATCFVDAGNAFKKADPQEAINCLMRAIEIYTDMVSVTACPVSLPPPTRFKPCHIASPPIPSPVPESRSIPSTDEAWLLFRAQGASPRPQAKPRPRPAPRPPQGRSSCPSGSGRRCLLLQWMLQETLRWAVQAPERQEVLSPSGSRAALGKAPGACRGSWRPGRETGRQLASEERGAGAASCSAACHPSAHRRASLLSARQRARRLRHPLGFSPGWSLASLLLGSWVHRASLGMDLVPSCPQVPGNDPTLWLPTASCPQVGTNAMDSPLLKYSAKDYFFKAALCHFCIDMLNAKLAVQKYEELFPAFSDSRECKLMKKLLEAHEEQNVDSYTEAVKEYDSISRLDQWLTTMLLRIKKTIQGDEEDLR
nr:alpha-soluble NSF attachment protein [Odocoileus virginianus texanus]